MSTHDRLELPRECMTAVGNPESRGKIVGVDTVALKIIHDIRNPLSAIHAAAELLIDSDLSIEQTQRLARSLYQASIRSQELLQHFVEFCRVQSPRRKQHNLMDLIEPAIGRLSSAAASQSVQIQQYAASDVVVMLDRPRIESVLDNLLNNALEMLPGGGLIRVSACREQDWALVEIRDTGPGVSPEIRHRLFQPFVSAGKKDGLGLGLAASYETVTEHGGRMWHSTEPGWGACFAFSLPIESASRFS
jgi:signal transduction histidine kinase